MPYGNYSYVIDSSFTPFSMQEMLVPFAMYKDEFEKQEAMLDELSKNTDTFKYLEQVAKDNPESKAAQIYNTYASDLKKYGDDFSANGLSMANSIGLRNMKRRYQGEIGRLAKAQTRLDEVMNLRRQMSAKDPSILYSTENLNIDNFLDDDTPNLYSISGTELYTKAATSAQALSKRIFSAGDGGSTLGGYYRDYVQKMGYTPEQLRQFGEQISTDFANWASTNIPELGMAANQILEANGVTENFKNNPSALRKAQQQVIRGLIDGAVYTESHNPTRDLGQMTAAERDASARAWASHNLAAEQFELSKAINGITGNSRTGFTYDPARSIKVQEAIAKRGGTGSTGSGSGSGGTGYHTMNEKGVRMTWNGNNPEATNGEADTDYEVKPLSDDDGYSGRAYDYNDLPTYAQIQALAIIGSRSNKDNYIYYFKPYKGGFFDDTEAVLDIVPRKIVKDDDVDTEDDFSGLFGVTQ